MGLDIQVVAGPLEKIAGSRGAISDDDYDALYCFGEESRYPVTVWNDVGFEDRAQPLTVGAVYASSKSWSFRAGSYGGYNRFRATLCRLALGVEPESVWADPRSYEGKPFVAQINFSDCEGVIGADVALDLADDYDALAERATVEMDEYDRATYDNFRRAFREVAATGGAVVFT